MLMYLNNMYFISVTLCRNTLIKTICMEKVAIIEFFKMKI